MELITRSRHTGSVRGAGFTLIELLMVVLVIAIMLSSVFALAAFTNNRSKRAQTIGSVEGLRAAIEEYFATFGVYPPTRNVDWSRVCEWPDTDPPGIDWQLVTGLYYHLYVGAGHDRWQTYLKDVKINGGGFDPKEVWLPVGGAPTYVVWSNCTSWIVDSWGQPMRYEVGTNYQSYVLYSTGPDGLNDTADDVGNETFNY